MKKSTIIFKHFAAAFCLDCAMMFGHTALPFYVFARLGGDERASGTIAAAISLCYMLVCLSTAEFVRRSGNGLKIAAGGAIGFGALFGAAGFAENVYLFGFMATAGFCGLAMAWPAMHAWLGGEADLGRRARLMAGFNIAWSLGMAIGTLTAGPAFDLYFRLPFFALAGLGFLAAILLYSQPHERDYFESAETATNEHIESAARVSEAYLPATWVAVLTGFAITGAARSVYPKHFETMVDRGALDLFGAGTPIEGIGAASLFSVLAFGVMITSVLVYAIMGRTARWQHRFAWVIALQALAALACWTMSRTQSMALLYLCYTVLGAATYTVFFAGIYYAVANPARKHRRAAINESLVGGGAFIGSLSFGWAAGFFSIAGVFAWAPAIVIGAIALELVLLRRVRVRVAG